jgi:hypothetical protein
LGGNRVGHWRWYFNLFLTFLVSGFWHGANWTYLVWGALNGTYLICGIWYDSVIGKAGLERYLKPNKYVQVISTFSLTCLAWIFFRARTVDDALFIVGNLFRDLPAQLEFLAVTLAGFVSGHLSIFTELSYGGKPLMPLNELALSTALIGFLLLIQIKQRYRPFLETLSRQPIWVRWAVYYGGIVALSVLGVYHGANEFIYFQF